MRKNLSKKTLSAFLAIVMTLATMAGMFTFSAGAETGSTVTDWTAKEIYLKTAQDFIDFTAKITECTENNGTVAFSGQTIKLYNNINLNPDWTASNYNKAHPSAPNTVLTSVGGTEKINNVTKQKGYFAGTFDGQGFAISGIYTKLATSSGIFGQVASGSTATIRNLVIKNSYFYDGGANQDGGLLGQVKGTANISNVYVANDVFVAQNSGNFGFMVGQVNGTVSVSNSFFAGTLTTFHGGGSTVVEGISGFVGYVSGTSTTIQNCVFAGDIEFAKFVSASSYITARTNNVSTKATITNCHYITDADVEYSAVTFEKTSSKYTTETPSSTTAYSDLNGVTAITEDALRGIGAQQYINGMELLVATTTGTPELRADVTVSATDNGKKISDGETDDFGWHGFQKKTGENSDSLRLLGTVKADALSKYDSIGFKAVAYFVDHAGNKVQTNSVTYTTVYESVAADGTPIEEDGSYFFAQTVKGIPQNAGDVIFEITTYAMQGSTEIIGDTYRIVYDCL